MKILLTGAFGNIGMSTLRELLRQGHQVRCFVTPRKAHERTARQFAGKIELIQGDIRRPADLFNIHPRLAVATGRVLVGPEEREDPFAGSWPKSFTFRAGHARSAVAPLSRWRIRGSPLSIPGSRRV